MYVFGICVDLIDLEGNYVLWILDVRGGKC